MKFDQTTLIRPILTAVAAAGYTELTPIQEKAIPILLEGNDLLGCAQTGTGKTAAFALPILQLITNSNSTNTGKSKHHIKSLILTPTRELALQIYENFEQYSINLPLRSAVIFGGVSANPQIDQLRAGVDILVATPGRLLDLIGQGYISLEELEIFVLDEADRMLDMGFIHDVRRVIRLLPERRQTLLFSATMPRDVEMLALSILHDPKTVKVNPESPTVDSIAQTVYFVDKQNKTKLLMHLINELGVYEALVFTRTKHGADKVARELNKNNISAMAIHGNKSQTARQTALASFKTGKISVLVATDIAARGIDISKLPLVVNYDIPEEAETYVHRIGRTGRAGLEGSAVSFCCADEFESLRAVEKLTGKIIDESVGPWPIMNLTPSPPKQNNGRGDRGGNRGGNRGGYNRGGDRGGNRGGRRR